MSRRTYIVSFIFLLGIFLIPLSLHAVGEPIGGICSTDSQCITNDCEDSSLDVTYDDYCVCQTSRHCANAYGGDPLDWICTDDNASSLSHALYYCKNIKTNELYKPTEQKGKVKPFLIGEHCSDNVECITGDCEDSDLSGDDDFCVCQTATHCAEAYGGTANDWICSDDLENQHHDLHYCQAKSSGAIKDPTTPEGLAQSLTPTPNVVTVNTGNVLPILDEIKLTIEKPQPKITIPGLEFSEVDLSKMVTEIGGNRYLNIPFLGEYLSAVYRYSIIIMTIIGVLGLMAGGVMWMMSGGTADGKTRAMKYMKNSIIGILLAVTSYTILYTINPNLVEFQNLKILWVQSENIHDVTEDANTFDDIKVPPCKKPNNPSTFAGLGVDETGPMDDFACGTRDLNKVRFLVIHEGARGDTAQVLINRGLSTHYIIQRDGTIRQTVGLEKRARHAGAINAESIGVDLQTGPGCSAAYKCSINPSCLAKCTYTDQQYDAMNTLIDFVAARTGITRSDARIIAHCQVSGTTHGDPRNFEWNRLGFDPCKHRKDCGASGIKACVTAWGSDNAYKGQVIDDTANPVGCCEISENGTLVESPMTQKDCEAMSNYYNFKEMSCTFAETGQSQVDYYDPT